MQTYERFRHNARERAKISPIKQRILHFAKTLGISKRSFYEKLTYPAAHWNRNGNHGRYSGEIYRRLSSSFP